MPTPASSPTLPRISTWPPVIPAAKLRPVGPKITDLTFSQTLGGRLFGYATIRIESANEESGLKDLSDLTEPVRFNRILVEMINAKQGNVSSPNVAVID